MSIKLRIRENGEKVYDIRVQYGGVRKSKSVQTTKSNAKRLTELTLQDFINYRSKRLKKVTPATVNREHTCFLRMLNVAVSDDSYQIYKNPIKGLKKFKEKPAKIIQHVAI